jgi:hypothetical protein
MFTSFAECQGDYVFFGGTDAERGRKEKWKDKRKVSCGVETLEERAKLWNLKFYQTKSHCGSSGRLRQQVPTIQDVAARNWLIELSVRDLSESRVNKKALRVALDDQSSANLTVITLLSLSLPTFPH